MPMINVNIQFVILLFASMRFVVSFLLKKCAIIIIEDAVV